MVYIKFLKFYKVIDSFRDCCKPFRYLQNIYEATAYNINNV